MVTGLPSFTLEHLHAVHDESSRQLFLYPRGDSEREDWVMFQFEFERPDLEEGAGPSSASVSGHAIRR